MVNSTSGVLDRGIALHVSSHLESGRRRSFHITYSLRMVWLQLHPVLDWVKHAILVLTSRFFWAYPLTTPIGFWVGTGSLLVFLCNMLAS